LDLLRTRFALQGTPPIYPSIISAIQTIYTSEGVRGFYRGVAPSVVQILPYMGCMFEAHSRVGSWIRAARAEDIRSARNANNRWLIPWTDGYDNLVSGAIAGTLSKLAVMPLDTTRKRLQLQFPDRHLLAHAFVRSYPSGFIRAMAQIVQEEGLRGLYRGTLPGIVKAAPGSAVTFTVVGWVEGALRKRIVDAS
ncbi:mitochondrial thiamine pyrophosphate transporter, partial [Gonapodya sp. JEL0774]